jgi:hypothetical protein
MASSGGLQARGGHRIERARNLLVVSSCFPKRQTAIGSRKIAKQCTTHFNFDLSCVGYAEEAL